MMRRFRHYPQIGGANPRPYDAEVDWIQGDNLSWIDLGISPNDVNSIRIKFETANESHTNNPVIFGGSQFAASMFMLTMQSNGYIRYWGGGSPVAGCANFEVADYEFSLTRTNSTTGVAIGYKGGVETYRNDAERITYAGTGNLFLFSVAGGLRASAIKLKELNINGEQYIPVRVGSVGSLYNKASGQMFSNQGTGAFVVGPDKREYTARDYVQDGLVGLWDGIENAGWGVHDSNATSWVDLTGTFVGTGLINNDGWTDNAKMSTSSSDVLTLSGRNISDKYEMCFRVSATPFDIAYIRLGRYGSSYFNDNGVYLGTSPKPFDFKIEKMKLYTFGDNYLGTPYINAKSLIDKDGTKPGYSGESDTQRFLRNTLGYLYCVRKYNRFLTEDERIHNYEVDVARFGLP